MSSGSAPRAAVAPQSKAAEPLRDHQPQSAGTEQRPPEPSWETIIYDPIAVFTLLLVLGTFALGAFTYRLWRATITLAGDSKASGETQAEKMERSIGEAAKAATAMEGVAASMVINAEQIVQSVGISRDIANQQRIFSQMQMRAYISVLIGDGLYQDQNLRFQAEPAILNSGHTPALNVRWRIAADILPVPIPADFKYPLPKEILGGSIVDPQQHGTLSAVVPDRVDDLEVEAIKHGVGKSLYVWGVIAYEDVFGRTRRRTFSQQMYWVPLGRTPEGSVRGEIRGKYLAKHNRGN